MHYSKIVSCYDSPAVLVGRTVKAIHSEYSVAVLLFDNDERIGFAVEEVSVGKWFEVFPFCLHELAESFPFNWRELDKAFTVALTELLWREEWLEAAFDSTEFLGAGPGFTQYASTLGAAPRANDNVIKVLAGIKLIDGHGRTIVVSSSDNTPFKIDLAVDTIDVDRIIRFHTCA